VKGLNIRWASAGALLFAHGNGGNFTFIVPELELVATFNGRNYGKPEQFIPMQITTQEIGSGLIPDRGQEISVAFR
jgi:hypothetical protein